MRLLVISILMMAGMVLVLEFALVDTARLHKQVGQEVKVEFAKPVKVRTLTAGKLVLPDDPELRRAKATRMPEATRVAAARRVLWRHFYRWFQLSRALVR